MQRKRRELKTEFYRYYSVYDRRTDEPVFIHGTADVCASAMGVKLSTFYQYITRMRKGEHRKKYDIVEEGREVDENG